LTEDFTSEVESRLDLLFQEGGESAQSIESSGGFGAHPLKALKAILLSVEWEITDSSMESLIKEIKTLEDFYKDDKLILVFLRLLDSIAKYVKVKKGNSHPNATSLLTSVYMGLEEVAQSKGLSRKEKEKILLQELEKFKKLKEDIIRRKVGHDEKEKDGAGIPKSEAPDMEKPAPDPAKVSSRESLDDALQEIKEVIREEFRALRAEIKLWRESR
jgi:hypothetical protein